MRLLPFFVWTCLLVFVFVICGYIYIEMKIADLNKNNVIVIAHAGGEIDGNIYTNSLEALNNSYEKGARVFELDISETKDGHLVAVHKWDEWAEFTSYQGDLPPTIEEFKKLRILGKYTALDFNDINNWFSEHEDATLITDKINNPALITSLFIDKDRLKMELFSKESLIAGGKLFDGGMANYDAFSKILQTPSAKMLFIPKANYLKNNNIKYIVTGAPTTMKDKLRLKIIRSLDVQVYMFFFGTHEQVEEQINKNRDYLDGAYYDKIPS
ncbi:MULTISPECIES: glycerophosphodiester phosphodiesterase family protein [Providencia]|uniref:glycerophosphodiester phosphodiesterase family protein n=2 Tax=Morganellaceae TaxID=1903414 RepID=UPI002349C715|nr:MULTISPECIES: glycerophosphodiester phosphodiesterase family protein [unclassified Providencia]WOC01180.1 glycerophosphodiester phosphodiesterase family protein [Providencia sp. PROV046]